MIKVARVKESQKPRSSYCIGLMVDCVCANWVIFHRTVALVDVMLQCLRSLLIDYLKLHRICWVVGSARLQRLPMSFNTLLSSPTCPLKTGSLSVKGILEVARLCMKLKSN